ncbi:hydantoinase/oxoprolinase family protein, partial [Mesorhizobium sp. M1E.F.Ca.ET.041.01.1.1]|uniref:hydantoinase/oxoprolinase family protein n=1 Tax=Mesorhizobium sp. M1E.F.Ca.ET.041.01.1.1 TaxID=2496759 RepID=UPI000FD2D44E
MWLACDTGGTFTDLVVDSNGVWRSFKSPTVAADPVRGVLNVLEVAAKRSERSLRHFLSEAEVLVHATTHAINAVLTGNVAKTALLVTEGHRDILTLREGGRPDPFDHRIRYPKSFISRDLVFPIQERIDSDGSIFKAIDEDQVIVALQRLKQEKIEALAVCLLWSVANAQHELRVAELIRHHLPGIPFTLSHQINPTPREFRRAVSTAIDASLKPMMSSYFGGLVSRLADAGFTGKVLVVTSQGGVMDAADVAQAPINLINSGPSMAPVAAQAYVGMDDDETDIIVADTGGTTFDVSVVRNGRIPLTRELWIGQPILGLPTGYPSIDVRSVGTGGGSVASIDAGGMLHVGPQSAGAHPGPACYGYGGLEPTVTDAALVLGYIDRNFFLGGGMRLDRQAAERAITRISGDATRIGSTAAAIIALATENMTQAIFDITVKQGVDPSKAVMVGGGGAAGLNAVFIARRLKCSRLIIPETGATLSAAGAQISELKADYRASAFMSAERFDTVNADRILASLDSQCQEFAVRSGASPEKTRLVFTVEARYQEQAWEIEVGLRESRFSSEGAVLRFLQAFHDEHKRLYGFADPDSAVEIVG